MNKEAVQKIMDDTISAWMQFGEPEPTNITQASEVIAKLMEVEALKFGEWLAKSCKVHPEGYWIFKGDVCTTLELYNGPYKEYLKTKQ